MRLYNSITKKIVTFEPIVSPKVGIYACGPTVYDYAHIGHMRKYVGDDVLVKALKYFGFEVKHVMNITDVGHLVSDSDEGEDKMEKGARKHGLDVWKLAEKFTDHFFNSTDLLNVTRPDVVCRATDHIAEQIDLIQKIQQKGFVYTISDGLYFDVLAYEKSGNKYGELSAMQDILEGARVDPNPEKKDPRDFALWKFSPKGTHRQMEWESPWGVGFPGWHIECSAMSMKYLGDQFDIHTGGIDHMEIHHPNEIAQSEAATGKKPFVKYWLHHGFLVVDGKKMSKSLGNIYTVGDICKKGYDPMSLRYLYLSTHYRKLLNFSFEALDAASTSISKLREIARSLSQQKARNVMSPEKNEKAQKYLGSFQKAIEEDLNTPQALAVVWELVKSNIPSPDKYEILLSFDEILGLGIRDYVSTAETSLVEEDYKLPNGNTISINYPKHLPPKVLNLVKKRENSRLEGNFAESDDLREEIQRNGWILEDGLGKTIVKNIK